MDHPCEPFDFQEILGDFDGGQRGSAPPTGLRPQCPGAPLRPAGATGTTQAAAGDGGGNPERKTGVCWRDFTWNKTNAKFLRDFGMIWG